MQLGENTRIQSTQLVPVSFPFLFAVSLDIKMWLHWSIGISAFNFKFWL